MSLQDVPVGRNAPHDVKGWEGADAARAEILESIARYNVLPERPENW